jgi:hypothetical protein
MALFGCREVPPNFRQTISGFRLGLLAQATCVGEAWAEDFTACHVVVGACEYARVGVIVRALKGNSPGSEPRREGRGLFCNSCLNKLFVTVTV